jgi:RNA polymerase sigma factor (sigma-70 family)
VVARPDAEHETVAETVRIEGARILATLIRTVGDVQVAEDAVQEANLAALRAWPVTGVPPQPRAWLTVTARRKAIDILRRERARPDKERDGLRMLELARSDLPPDDVVHDDLLRLIFTCCHPALSPPTRVALALRTLCGLSPAQIADVLLTTEPATAKRLTRARQKIAAAHISYRVPAEDELADRLPAVCGVIHSLYTAGHAPVEGVTAYDVDMCAEAIRLAELLHELLPDQSMPAAVLALLLLTEARRPARLDERGEVVTLDQQDRGRWDAAAIARGIELLNLSLRRSNGQADAYQLQAAIAAEHDRAASYQDTDSTEILRLYDLLVSIAPSPAASLGRVVAAAEAADAATGLAMLAELPPSPRWHAVRAELLARQGRYAEAAGELAEALDGPATAPERRHRERRRDAFLERALATAPAERDPL